MKVTYLKPSVQISEYVHEVLVLEEHLATSPFVLPLFANGMPTLLFQTTRAQIGSHSNHLTLFGQTVAPDKMILRGNFTLIAYFLKPHALASLFGLSAQELTDAPIDLLLHCSVKTKELQDRLLHAGSVKRMLALLDGYLFELAAKAKVDTSLIKHATNTIVHQPEHKILRDLQNDLCVTERTFQRMFDRLVGVSPNQFRRICQFNNAFQELNRNRAQNLTDLTFRHGYADQSHFIRSFKEFTHLAPTAYLNYTPAS